MEEIIRAMAKEIDKALMATDHDYCVIEDDGKLCIDICWGDWKHDHAYTDWFVKQFVEKHGYYVTNIYERIYNEDGSDSYSADHIYTIER